MPTNQRSEATERRHGEILDAAARIFHEKGYAATSIQDVAEAVGILKGSLYYYIDTKEDLLFEVIQRIHRVGLESLEQLRASDAPALTTLRTAIEGHVRNNLENLVDIGVFFHDFRSLSRDRRATIVEERDLYDQFLRELIRRGQDEGSIDPDVDPKLATMGLLGMMNWVYQWYRCDGPAGPDEVAASFADLALAGLAVGRHDTSRRDIGRPEEHA